MRAQVSTGTGVVDACGVEHPSVGSLLRAQQAMIAHDQLVAFGFHRRAIQRRVDSGRLTPLHRGVYLAGPVMPRLGPDRAAVLACGKGAYVSHASAAYLHQVPPYPAKPRSVELVALGREIRRPGIVTRRVQELHEDEVTTIENIPVTTLPRTALDLSAVLSEGELQHLIAEAYTKDLSETKLRSLLERYPGRPGTPALRGLLDRERGPQVTDSEAEWRFLELVRAARLPEPRTGARIGPYKVDFLWPAQRLIVEVDGYRFHSSRARFEADRRRDQDLISRRFVVIRVTWSQIVDEPHALIARVAAALVRTEVTQPFASA